MRTQRLNARRAAEKYKYFQGSSSKLSQKLTYPERTQNSCNPQQCKAQMGIPPTLYFPPLYILNYISLLFIVLVSLDS